MKTIFKCCGNNLTQRFGILIDNFCYIPRCKSYKEAWSIEADLEKGNHSLTISEDNALNSKYWIFLGVLNALAYLNIGESALDTPEVLIQEGHFELFDPCEISIVKHISPIQERGVEFQLVAQDSFKYVCDKKETVISKKLLNRWLVSSMLSYVFPFIISVCLFAVTLNLSNIILKVAVSTVALLLTVAFAYFICKDILRYRQWKKRVYK